MYISFFGHQNLDIHAGIPVWKSFWIRHGRHLLDIEFEIKSCLDNLYNHNYLSKDDYKFLRPCGSKPGVMYGLSKVHKGTTDNDNVPPFRPIFSAIRSYN